MMKYILLAFAFCLMACQQNNAVPQENTAEQNDSAHQDDKDNFTINRLLIVNDKDEILMAKEQWVWAAPSYLYSEQQFVKESLDSLANAYGVQIDSIQLRGQFSFKYDYQPYATIRNYYVAKYVAGDLKVPEGMDKAEWIPKTEAIEKNTVTAIKQISKQLMENPNVVWGGSFMVSHVGDDHPTTQVEAFYPLFGQ